MRYALTALVFLSLGIAAMAPAASAQMVNQHGNQIVPVEPGGTIGYCYMDGGVYSFIQPAPLTVPSPAAGSTMVGDSGVCRAIGSCYHPPFWMVTKTSLL
jgi:hypothetical protein